MCFLKRTFTFILMFSLSHQFVLASTDEHYQNKTYKAVKDARHSGQLTKAKTIAEKHLQVAPNDLQVLLELGYIAYQQNQHALAADYFLTVLEQKPDYLNATLGLIQTRISQRKYKKVITLLAGITEPHPTHVELENNHKASLP